MCVCTRANLLGMYTSNSREMRAQMSQVYAYVLNVRVVYEKKNDPAFRCVCAFRSSDGGNSRKHTGSFIFENDSSAAFNRLHLPAYSFDRSFHLFVPKLKRIA